MLQIIGASRVTASIPFQVYHMPGEKLESLWSWVTRTLSSSPVETLYGLYDMVRHSTREAMRLHVDALVGLANISSGVRYFHLQHKHLLTNYPGLGGIPTVAKNIPPFEHLGSGDE